MPNANLRIAFDLASQCMRIPRPRVLQLSAAITLPLTFACAGESGEPSATTEVKQLTQALGNHAGAPIVMGTATIDDLGQILVSGNQFGRLLWDPNPTVPYTAHSVIDVGDVDGDNVEEIVIGDMGLGQVHVVKQTGFPNENVFGVLGYEPDFFFEGCRLAVGKLDDDTRAEIVVACPDTLDGNVLIVPQWNEDFSGWPVSGVGFSNGSDIEIADLNADGWGEIIIGNASTGSVQFYSHPDHPLAPDYPIPTFTPGGRITAGELNSDGVDDLIVATEDFGVNFYTHPGQVPPANVLQGVGFASGLDIAAGDINADGLDEVLVGVDQLEGVVYSPAGPLPEWFIAPFELYPGDTIAVGEQICQPGDLDCDGAEDAPCPPSTLVDCIATVMTPGCGQVPGLAYCDAEGVLGQCDSLQSWNGVDEQYNQLDDDCDGLVDECPSFQPWLCTANAGTPGCEAVPGIANCTHLGAEACDAIGYLDVDESINGVDDDCNGVVDECWSLSAQCTVDLGPGCGVVPGVAQCDLNTGWPLQCVPTGNGAEEILNGLDDNCNGVPDECVGASIACTASVSSPGCTSSPGVAQCDPNTQQALACVAVGNGNPELPNGIDDNCDGVGLGDEFCDGEDNDDDGRYDEDAGSCLMRILLVPLCWQGTDAEFEDALADQRTTFLSALGLNACEQNIAFVGIPPSTVNVIGASCGPSVLGDYYQDVEAAVEALADERFALLDFDAVAGLTDTDLEGSTRGLTDMSGRFWSETFEVPFTGVVSKASHVTVHEFGHVVGLDDEYCSTVTEPAGSTASTICNSPSGNNPMSAAFGCDPASDTCCDQSFRHPGFLNEYPNDATPCGGEYHICCLGNSAVQDASLPLGQLMNDPVGRCPMGSSITDEPRRFCQACLTHVRSTTPYTCGNTFDGTERILEVKLISDPGVNSTALTSYRAADGRIGWQEYAPTGAGDPLVRFVVRSTSLELGTRRFPQTTTSESTSQERVGAERMLRVPLPAEVADDEPITMFVEVDGTITTQVTLNGEPPVPVVEGQLVECEGPGGTQVMLDASDSSDPDGDPISFSWQTDNGVELAGAEGANPSGLFPVGDTEVTLTVTDSAGLEASVSVTVTVEDTIAPVFVAQTPLSLQATTCGLDADDVEIVVPRATDVCAAVVEVTGVLSGSLEVGPEDASVSLPLGGHSIEWIADDGYNQTPLTQSLDVLPAFWANRNLDVRDRARVLQRDQSAALVVNRGTSFSRLGASPARVGTLLSRAKVESYGGTIDGDVRTQSSYQAWNGAQVTGQIFQWQTVTLPIAPATPVVSHGTQDVIVNSGIRVLAPGNYRDLIVNSGSPSPTVVLSAGTYTFRSLTSNTASAIRVPSGANPILRVKNGFNYRGGFVDQQGAPRPVRVAFAGTNAVLEGPFDGTFVAPAANLELGVNAQSVISGQFVARDLLVRPDVKVTCQPSSTLDNTFTF